MLSETSISKSIFASVDPLWLNLVSLRGTFWNTLWPELVKMSNQLEELDIDT